MRTLLTLTLALALGFFIVGCKGEDKPEKPDTGGAEKQVDEGADKAKEGADKVGDEVKKAAE